MNQASNPMSAALDALRAGDLMQAESLLDQALAQIAEHPPALVLKARLARQRSEFAVASALLERARVGAQGHPQWLSERGYLALSTGDAGAAISAFETLLEQMPDYADGHFNLAQSLQLQGRVEAAIVHLERALALNVARPHEAHTELGNALLLRRREDDAAGQYEMALAKRPGYSRALYGLGTVRAAQGQFEDALRHFRHALDDEPAFVEALQQIAEHKRFEDPNDPDITAMRAALMAPEVNRFQREKLGFALGKAMDDCGEHAEAYTFYEQSNGLKRARSAHYDAAGHEALVDRVMRVYDAELTLPEMPSDEAFAPILIVGMPRSGTTLIDTMLARHPDIDSAGELDYFERVARTTLAPYPEGVAEAKDEALLSLGAGYLDTLREHGAARAVTDKFPANFLHLGLVARLFPNAVLIHSRRHALDTCLSIYFQDFAQGNDYANALDDIAHYYAQYVRIMAFWQEQLGERLLHVDYEHVVDDQDSELRRLLTHAGVSYDERCLDSAYNPTVVATLSRWQVRQPVYSRSVERWRHYRAYLEPLAEKLDITL
ncbi:MAG: sulfotransferase [Gammaproteobacteria bacterium]